MSSAENSPYIVEDRRMISRVSANRIKITHTIEPGRRVNGILTCCNAPKSCPLCACLFPCCDYPPYIINEMNASRYVYVRENSIEWNNPTMRMDRSGNGCEGALCCGSSCSTLTVQDNVSVLYFDDIDFQDVYKEHRCCRSSRSACCGSRGELVRIESFFGCGLFQRVKNGLLCCIPSFCPPMCCPCVDRHEIWVEDGNTAAKVIQNARDNAKQRMKL